MSTVSVDAVTRCVGTYGPLFGRSGPVIASPFPADVVLPASRLFYLPGTRWHIGQVVTGSGDQFLLASPLGNCQFFHWRPAHPASPPDIVAGSLRGDSPVLVLREATTHEIAQARETWRGTRWATDVVWDSTPVKDDSQSHTGWIRAVDQMMTGYCLEEKFAGVDVVVADQRVVAGVARELAPHWVHHLLVGAMCIGQDASPVSSRLATVLSLLRQATLWDAARRVKIYEGHGSYRALLDQAIRVLREIDDPRWTAVLARTLLERGLTVHDADALREASERLEAFGDVLGVGMARLALFTMQIKREASALANAMVRFGFTTPGRDGPSGTAGHR